MTYATLTCDVCHGESGGEFVGVACIPGVPMSIAWCRECLKRDSAPAWVFEHDFIYVANGNLNALTDWARSRVTWADGRYIPFDEYVKRITPEEVAKAQAEYEAAARGSAPDEP